MNHKLFNQVYINSVGVYIPPYRIAVDTIAKSRKQDGSEVVSSLGVFQKSVAAYDEDTVTLAVAAAEKAINLSKLDKSRIGAVFVGSESHPYAVKPTGTIVGQWLGLLPSYYCADLEFACKAGTAGFQIVAAMIEAGMIDAGLVIGVDKAQSRPGDALEFTAASAGVAMILSRYKGLAKLQATHSYSTDTPDFWRRQNQTYPTHMGRFTGEPAYFRHIEECTTQFLSLYHKQISDFNHVVLHMPNGKFPKKIASKLGVTDQQLSLGFTVKYIGNPYSASSMLGLSRVLLGAERREEILVTSYGSGSGSDVFWLTQVKKAQKHLVRNLDKQLNANLPLSYIEYLQNMGTLSL